MGNCLRSDKAVVQNEEQEQARGVNVIDEVKRKRKLSQSDLEEKRRVVMRIKVVVTREELEQIMNSSSKGDYLKEYSSVEKLVTAMKLRGRRVSEVDNNGGCRNSNWRPALESIPEDRR